MPQDVDREKTEAPTPKRRKEARDKGQVAKSPEVHSAAVLSAAFGAFFFTGVWMYGKLADMMRWSFGSSLNLDLDISSTYMVLSKMMWLSFWILSPLVLTIAAAGIASNLIQTGFLFTGYPLTPRLSRLDPVAGIRRILSLRGFFELAKSLVKILLISFIVYVLLKGEVEKVPALIRLEPGDIFIYICKTALKIGLYVCLSLCFLALIDYAWQRWEYEKELRMTFQELKDETRETEGDPKIKARIKSIQMDIQRRRMMAAMPNADVVITNPTRIAVAVQYDPAEMSAPTVIAKGAGFIAVKIREAAQQYNVPLVENKPLAGALYKTVDIGSSIPVDLYRAVAEILAYVYRLKGKAV